MEYVESAPDGKKQLAAAGATVAIAVCGGYRSPGVRLSGRDKDDAAQR
jgi:hypothetical protein